MATHDEAVGGAPGATVWRDGADPWREPFVLELRLARVRGTRVGDLLAEVESHCLESGQTPLDAFGDPHDYAREIVTTLRTGDVVPEERPYRLLGTATAALIGIPVLLSAVDGVVKHRPAQLGVGQVVSVGCAAVLWLAVAALPRLLRQPRPVVWALLWLALMLVNAPIAVWRQPVAHLPAFPMLVVGTILVGAGVAAVARRAAHYPDPLVDPRDGTDRGWAGAQRWLGPFLIWSLPVMLAVAVTVIALTP